MRQPVMAANLEKPLMVMTRSATSGREAMLMDRTPS